MDRQNFRYLWQKNVSTDERVDERLEKTEEKKTTQNKVPFLDITWLYFNHQNKKIHTFAVFSKIYNWLIIFLTCDYYLHNSKVKRKEQYEVPIRQTQEKKSCNFILLLLIINVNNNKN